ncbi:MAG TPA: DUF2812 domain-containing protein [Ruminiclostridium sp.]|nr:DUF2812 domain-containing protein [Ruminiclostridium sp.]
MIKVFKWWWAWEYETIEDWLESMEAGGLRLIDTSFKGLYFSFERCKPGNARYCIDYQSKLTPDYVSLVKDDGWELFQVGMGWYILRKEYGDERPSLYTDFESLVARNKSLLTVVAVCLLIEIISFSNLIWDTYMSKSTAMLANVCIWGSAVLAFFTFAITNLALQISKFRRKK